MDVTMNSKANNRYRLSINIQYIIKTFGIPNYTKYKLLSKLVG